MISVVPAALSVSMHMENCIDTEPSSAQMASTLALMQALTWVSVTVLAKTFMLPFMTQPPSLQLLYCITAMFWLPLTEIEPPPEQAWVPD
jgi:drug/metabolite transporter (DMT)-like permease